MDENPQQPGSALGYQIFHELGKLSSTCDGIIRAMGEMRIELNSRSQEMLRQLTEHTRDDTTNFLAHDKKFESDDIRMKSLENTRSTLKGALIATNAFWAIVVVALTLWISYKGG